MPAAKIARGILDSLLISPVMISLIVPSPPTATIKSYSFLVNLAARSNPSFLPLVK